MGPRLRGDDTEFLSAKMQKTPGRKKSRPGAAIKNLRRVVTRDRLGLEIFLQTVFAPFAAVAGLLVAAERRGAVVRHALQIDVAGTDAAADLAGGFHGIGGDVT